MEIPFALRLESKTIRSPFIPSNCPVSVLFLTTAFEPHAKQYLYCSSFSFIVSKNVFAQIKSVIS